MHFQQIAVELTGEHGQFQRVSGKVCLEFLQADKPELMQEQEKTLHAEVMRIDKAYRDSKYQQKQLHPYLGAMRFRHVYGNCLQRTG